MIVLRRLANRSGKSSVRIRIYINPPAGNTWLMTKKERITKLVDEKSGLMECLVCGEKFHATMKPGSDGKFLPENWECVNKCRLIHHDEKTVQKK
jgi:hypothetical protein